MGGMGGAIFENLG